MYVKRFLQILKLNFLVKSFDLLKRTLVSAKLTKPNLYFFLFKQCRVDI